MRFNPQVFVGRICWSARPNYERYGLGRKRERLLCSTSNSQAGQCQLARGGPSDPSFLFFILIRESTKSPGRLMDALGCCTRLDFQIRGSSRLIWRPLRRLKAPQTHPSICRRALLRLYNRTVRTDCAKAVPEMVR